MYTPYLYSPVLLCAELVSAYGSHRDVGPDGGLVIHDERQGVHAAEGGADDHHRVQAQLLTHLLQEPTWGQLPHRCRGRGCLGLTEAWNNEGTGG